ncbi:unnamed protein product [Adineta steineri]|uniref:Pheromone-processing carboxypeptidase KEX1 n=1 Tax=Adineta steineri TaxID=433720 RepID=A0A813PUB1_9BILA|nr:unnamed protein product [Adineta steineri]CAF0795732.1 unnamed protein product [Adineta steineri]
MPHSSSMITQLFILFSIVGSLTFALQAADFFVHDLPLLPKGASSIRMHAGLLPVNPQHHGSLFFWHFEKKYPSDKLRTVIWLDGGPGCSSVPAALMEIGPFRFQDENTMIENDGSWHLYTNLLFVDQPVGTGFSTIDTDSFIHELDEMADQFLGFLDQYIKIFPELLENDIYLAGVSFAGQYIPYIAKAILEQRSTLKLRGLLIGNGLIDPVTTYKSYLPFAVANNLVIENSELYDHINIQVRQCEDALSKQVHVFEEECYSILWQISGNGAMNNYHVRNQKGRCFNIYDIRLNDTRSKCGENWPPDLKYVTSYLRRQDVTSSININDKKVRWELCPDSVFDAFKAQHSQPSITLLPNLLQQIPIILYSGEYDLICNHWGTEAMIDSMTWNNGTGFDFGNGTFSPKDPWIVDGESAGLIQSARNLTYILFYNAGHRVTYYYPRRSRFMLHEFIQLDLVTFPDTTTTRNNTEESTQSTRRIDFIVLTIIIITIALTGLIWFFGHKRYPNKLPKPFNIIRVLQSKTHNIEQQEWVKYSLLNDSNADLDVVDSETDV